MTKEIIKKRLRGKVIQYMKLDIGKGKRNSQKKSTSSCVIIIYYKEFDYWLRYIN